MDSRLSFSKVSESEPLSRLDDSTNCSHASDCSNCQKERSEKSCGFRKRKRRRGRNRPYSAKNFLGRPKINAPANTTQFLFADKEYYSKISAKDDTCQLIVSTSNSESESSLNTSSSTNVTCTSTNLHASSINNDDDASYHSICFDDDRFLNEEFDQVYDDVRAELLRNQSVEELSSHCIELESVIHNLQYLLEKETKKRQQMEEILFLTRWNKELSEENLHLQQSQESSVAKEHKLNNNSNELNINNVDVNET